MLGGTGRRPVGAEPGVGQQALLEALSAVQAAAHLTEKALWVTTGSPKATAIDQTCGAPVPRSALKSPEVSGSKLDRGSFHALWSQGKPSSSQSLFPCLQHEMFISTPHSSEN